MKSKYILFLLVLTLIFGITNRNEAQRTELFDRFSEELAPYSFGTLQPNGSYVMWPGNNRSEFMRWLNKSGKYIKKDGYRINTATISPIDGNQKVALGGKNGKILYGNASETSLKKYTSRNLPGEKEITAIVFSPDNQTLAIGTKDGEIVLWDTESHIKLPINIEPLRKNISSVAFSPNGDYLATGTTDGYITIWHVYEGKKIYTRKGHQDWINSVAFSPNSQILATCADDKLIKLWNIPDVTDPVELKGHVTNVKVVAFSPDQKHLVSGGSDGEVLIWDRINNNKKIDPRMTYVEKNETVQNAPIAHEKEVLAITFSENGEMIYSICKEKYVKWYLDEIDIIPERSELFSANKPVPLIEKIRGEDNIAPVIEISDEVVRRVPSETTEVVIRGTVTDELNGVALLTVEGKKVEPNPDGEFQITVDLKEGRNEITIVAEDNKGNSNVSEPYILEIYREELPDIEKPIVVVENPEFLNKNEVTVNYNKEDFELSIHATDDRSGIKEVRVNDKLAEKQNETGKFTATVPLVGERTQIKVYAIDNKGKISEIKVYTIIRQPMPDKALPTITIIEPTGIVNGGRINADQTNINIQIQVTDDKSKSENINVTINNLPAPDDVNGMISKEINLTDGANAISIKATDEAGKTFEFNFTVYRQLPVTPPEPTISIKPIGLNISKREGDNLPRAKSTTDKSITIFGKVDGLGQEDKVITITNKPKESATELPRKLVEIKEEGFFTEDDIKLLPGDNIITLGVLGKDVTYTFVIQCLSTDSPGGTPIQPPGPTDKPSKSDPLIIKSIVLKGVKFEGFNQPDWISVAAGKEEIEIRFDSPNLNSIPRKVEVITSEYIGKISITGTTQGPNENAALFYSFGDVQNNKIESYNNIKLHEFNINNIELDYGVNEVQFFAGQSNQLADHSPEITIVRKHEREFKDHAILIAVEEYGGENPTDGRWKKLDNPIKDIEKLQDMLERRYNFHVTPLPNPNKNEIEEAIENFADFIDSHSEEDLKEYQLLVFFAGHGWYEERKGVGKIGYFIPNNENILCPEYYDVGSPEYDEAKLSIRRHAIEQADIIKDVTRIPCNVLIVMDTCYGSAFTTEQDGIKYRAVKPIADINILLTKMTKQFLTSGEPDKMVPDGKKGYNSPFVNELYNILVAPENNSPISFNNLLAKIKNADFGGAQKPVAGELIEEGHEQGAEFVFWPK